VSSAGQTIPAIRSCRWSRRRCLASYWAVGPYDIVSIAEFPDDESGTAFLLTLGAEGNICITLRAHTADEMTGIFQKPG
jgi:uncharacterized protein with GYD domain